MAEADRPSEADVAGPTDEPDERDEADVAPVADRPGEADVAPVAAPADHGDVAEVADRVLASRKYRHLDRGFVERISAEARQRAANPAQAAKEAKRRLHQAYGAFLQGDPAGSVHRALHQMRDDGVPVKEALLPAMRAHASTAERVPYIEAFASLLADWCGRPASVVDLACGLGPLTIPWLSLAPHASYWCCDVDAELVAALNQLDGVVPVRLHVEARDLVADPPSLSAELGLMLKTVTTLEQQRRGQSTAALARLRCRHVVLSLPRRSLGGRRGYTRNPLDEAARLAAATHYEVRDDAPLGTEHLVHLVSPWADASDAETEADATDATESGRP